MPQSEVMSPDEFLGTAKPSGEKGVMSPDEFLGTTSVQAPVQVPQVSSGQSGGFGRNLVLGAKEGAAQLGSLGAFSPEDLAHAQNLSKMSDDQLAQHFTENRSVVDKIVDWIRGGDPNEHSKEELPDVRKGLSGVSNKDVWGLGLHEDVQKQLGEMKPEDRDAFLTGKVPRALGQAAPILAGGPAAPAMGAFQALGGANIEQAEGQLGPKEASTVKAERALMGAVLGLAPGIPGGKVVGSLGAAGLAVGTNVLQAGAEAAIREQLGVKSKGVWDSMVESMKSGDTWAQALVFGGIHAIVAGKSGRSGEGQKPTPFGKLSEADQLQLMKINQVRADEGLKPIVPGTAEAETLFKTGTQPDKAGPQVGRPANETSDRTTIQPSGPPREIPPEDFLKKQSEVIPQEKSPVEMSESEKLQALQKTFVGDDKLSPQESLQKLHEAWTGQRDQDQLAKYQAENSRNKGSVFNPFASRENDHEPVRAAKEGLDEKLKDEGRIPILSRVRDVYNTVVGSTLSGAKRLANTGDQPAVKEYSEKLTDIANKTRSLSGDIMEKIKPTISELNKPLSSQSWNLLKRFDVPGENGGKSKSFFLGTRLATEPNGPAHLGLTPPEKLSALGDKFAGAVRSIGEMTEPYLGNKAVGEMPRLSTPNFFSMLLDAGPLLNTWDKELVRLNPGLDPQKLRAQEISIRNDFLNKDIDFAALEKKVSVEFKRTVPVVPSGVYDGKTPVMMFHDMPQEHLTMSAEKFAGRAAFQSVMGDEKVGDIRTKLNNVETGNKNASAVFDRAVADIHGIPRNVDKIIAPNTPGGFIAGGVRAVQSPAFALSLMTAPFHIALQPLVGQGPQTFGYGRTLEGLKFLASDAGGTKIRLQRLGALDHIFTNLALDPNNLTGSAGRTLVDLMRSGTNFTHWVNALTIGSTATVLADDAQAGRLSKSEQLDFVNAGRQMDLQKPFLEKLARGEGSKEDYDNFIRQTSVLTGRGLTSGEKSGFENSKLFNLLMPANTYPLTTARAMDQSLRVMLDSHASPGEQYRATKTFLMKSTGIVATGFLVNLVRGLISGGKSGLDMAYQEDQDKRNKEPLMWALSTTATGWGGPMAIAYRQMSSDSPMDASHISYPAGLLMDFAQVFSGTGKYKDMDMMEKWKSFGLNRAHIGVVANTYMSILAGGEKSVELDNAIKGKRDWERMNDIPRTTVVGGSSDPESWRAELRRATQTIRENRDPSDELRKALGAKNFGDLSAAIDARRVLRVGDKDMDAAQIQSLREHIGEGPIQKLIDYDQTLSAWAISLGLVSRASKLGATKVAQNLVSPLEPDQLQALKGLAGARQTIKGLRNEIRSKLRTQNGSDETASPVGGE